MSQILRRTFLSLALLVVAAAFLLLSDLHSRNGGRRSTGGQSKTKVWRIQQVSYIETVLLEDAIHGFKTGLTEAGLKEDADYTIQSACAQGDVATLNSIIDAAVVNGVDMFVVYSTPTLQTAVKKIQGTPIVFTLVANPFIVGAGKDDTHHLPNITGVYTQGPYAEVAEIVRTYFPQIKRVGTLFCPAEVNSVANKDLFVQEATKRGLTVEVVAANTSGELPDAALALCGRQIDAVVQIVDNLSAAGFPSIGRAAAQSRMPLITCQSTAMKQGASFAVARDYFDGGREAGLKAAKVIRGESPATIPFAPVEKTKNMVNLKNAQACGLTIPPALIQISEKVTDDNK